MAQVGIIKSCFFFAATCSNPHHHHPHSVFPNKSSLLFSSASSPPFPSFKNLSSSSITHFYGHRLLLGDTQTLFPFPKTRTSSTNAQMGIRIGKSQRWWEKDLQPNMKEVSGAQDLVNSLLNAGDDLVVVDFFSPGCAGCKALHPKICQLAGMNPHVQFLQVNYEEHKSMCYSLNVHVLPFFRFYRGAHGRVCSFSCTNATIKKFKDALAKYGADCCSLGPAKGLEEKELLALAANRDLSFSYTPKSEPSVAVPSREEILTEAVAASPPANLGPPLPLPRPLSSIAESVGSQNTEKNSLVSSGR